MPTIMVADDTQFIRIRLGKLLAEQGYVVVEAADGVEAIDVYRSSMPDVVLMDLTMPNKDGLAALMEICRFDPHARVIMLTALGQQSLMIEAIRAGARDFLVKPCEPERVVDAVRRILKKSV
jgi:two-component system, chemotaxis family, chemotaxis protein CheY